MAMRVVKSIVIQTNGKVNGFIIVVRKRSMFGVPPVTHGCMFAAVHRRSHR